MSDDFPLYFALPTQRTSPAVPLLSRFGRSVGGRSFRLNFLDVATLSAESESHGNFRTLAGSMSVPPTGWLVGEEYGGDRNSRPVATDPSRSPSVVQVQRSTEVLRRRRQEVTLARSAAPIAAAVGCRISD